MIMFRQRCARLYSSTDTRVSIRVRAHGCGGGGERRNGGELRKAETLRCYSGESSTRVSVLV